MTIGEFKKLLEQFDENEQLTIAEEYGDWSHIGGLNLIEQGATGYQDRMVIIFPRF